MTDQQDRWIDLIDNTDYEINDTTHQIRRKKGNMIIKETVRPDGYIQVRIGGVSRLKHRLIAQHFIPNPDNLPCIDHVDRCRSNNSLSNLRWVTYSENGTNRSCHKKAVYEYVDELPEETIVVDRYSAWEFEDLYFHDDVFYVWNGLKYRKLRIYETKSGHCSVSAKDTYGTFHPISYVKFKREYDLV